MSKASRDRQAYALLLLVMLLWASGVIVARFVAELTAPIGFSFWRWGAAVIILTPVAWRETYEKAGYLRSRLGAVMLLGLFIAGGSTLLVWSVQYTTATNVSLISAAQPIVTAVMAWVILHDRLTPIQLTGTLAAAVGVLIMVVQMDFTVLVNLSFNPGDLLILSAVVFYACYAIYLHRWLEGVSALLMMYVSAIAGLVVIAPFYVLEVVFVQPFNWAPDVVRAMVFMALVPTVLATTMWNRSVGIIGPGRASIFINLLPIFGTGMAVLFLHEAPHVYHLIGGALVCIGITAVVRGGRV